MMAERRESDEANTQADAALKASVIAVGGGKGGIGKTVVSACLAMALAEAGRQVVLVDGDLGGSNLNTVMGMQMPSKTIYDFFSRKIPNLSDLVIETPFSRLKMIAGAPGTLGMANIKHWEKLKIMRHITQLNAHYVVVDLGAGMSFNEIDFFNLANVGIVVANPEPPSLQECYNFIKVALLRRLRTLFSSNESVQEVLSGMDNNAYINETRPIFELIAEISRRDAEAGREVKIVVDDYRPYLLLNQLYDDSEKVEAYALRLAARDLLHVDVELMGTLPHSARIREAIQEMQPAGLYGINLPVRRKLLEVVKKYFLASE